MKIDGNKIAQKILNKLKEKVKKLNTVPKLAIVLIGNDPISKSYVKQKEEKAKEIGIKTITIKLPKTTTKETLSKKVRKLNNDKSIHGIIIQRPLPPQIDQNFATNIIVSTKDVDSFRKDSLFKSPMSQAIYEILNSIGILSLLKTKKITVIGKGETGGMPIINFLKEQGTEPEIIDTKTKNPERIIRTSDIIISTVGKKDILKTGDLKQGVILIGIGNYKNAKGEYETDYNQKEVKKIASFYTPVPGGVGPITVAMLLKNLVKAAEKR